MIHTSTCISIYDFHPIIISSTQIELLCSKVHVHIRCLPFGVSSLRDDRNGTPVSQIPATVYERSLLEVFCEKREIWQSLNKLVAAATTE